MSIYGYDPINETETPLAGLAQVDGTLSSTSENPIQNKAVASVVNDMNNVLGAKNLLQNTATSQVISGVTFTVNSDGSVTADGTATANATFHINVGQTIPKCDKYILSGCPSGGNASSGTYCLSWPFHGIDTGDSVELSYIEEYHSQILDIVVWNGATVSNLTFYPMLRPASIKDNTYAPYSRTNQELTGEVEPMLNVLGAKNLLPNRAVTTVANGMTFTVNSDGTITLDGTTSALTVLHICGNLSFDIYRQYIISGFGERASGNAYLQIAWSNGQYSLNGAEEWIFTPKTEKATWVEMVLGAGQSFSNYVVKPMIRPAYIKDNTFVPYAMTNRELSTPLLNVDVSSYLNTSVVNLAEYFRYSKLGRLVILDIGGIYSDTDTSGGEIILNSGAIPKLATRLAATVSSNSSGESAIVFGPIGDNVLAITYMKAGIRYYGSIMYLTLE